MVRQLLVGAIGVKERVPGRRRLAPDRIAMELLDHRNERREARARSDHQDLLEAGRALGEGEIPDDALHVGEPVVLLRFHPSEERLGEPAQHSVLSLLEHHVEFEVVPLRRLERGRGDRIRVGDRAPLLLPLRVEVRHVPDPISVLDLAREQAVISTERDVLARLVRRKSRAVVGDDAEEGQAV